ncbi:YkvI family membrane protein [Alicyclobacillus macrosporangiidus]|uniref:Uncharacterized membrane protein YkvI n=1 Tax=Alicyclobacillus macrosporangiidus TaxID=392015 RepID=A0A1I7KU40_9BACL|nr:hypothetical protein [Alicyclobacillus macrosporangiidus]SFV00973.1 Uncharacterized membrane protein YkvI [Alicyclobacillus macrosporangiidus]
MRRTGWMAFQVGCAYIGTVVGAGFASGQEVFQFFGRYGNWAYLTILLSFLLFAGMGYRLMQLGAVWGVRSYHELNERLFGPGLTWVLDAVILTMLFGVTVAMIAGSGALFQERLGGSFQLGALVTMGISYITVLWGIRGILRANTLIVPAMCAFVLYAAWHTWHAHGWRTAWHSGHALGGPGLATLVSALLYAAFNTGLSAGVLLPLGADVRDLRTLRFGALIGALGLAGMLAAVTFTLHTYFPRALEYDVPMAYVAEQLGALLRWGYVFVLWAEVYSTLVGDLYALTAQLGTSSPRRNAAVTAAVLMLAYLVSQVGFSAVVQYAYTAFGWISAGLLLVLLWPREKLPRG